LEHSVSVNEEIERKYLLARAPTLPADATVREIEQGYLPSREMEERVRRIQEGERVRFKRTIKVGSGVRRFEFEEEIDAEVFDTLWTLTEGRRIRKRRHVVQQGDLVWEVDEFLDRDLWLAEIELPSEEHPFEVPAWLAAAAPREVTESGEYANRKLAR
jgi:CYTH domain-containing protein